MFGLLESRNAAVEYIICLGVLDVLNPADGKGGTYNEFRTVSVCRRIQDTWRTEAPGKLYFHQHARTPAGDIPYPWGAWSLDAALVTPTDETAIPGVRLDQSVIRGSNVVLTFSAAILVSLLFTVQLRPGVCG